MTLDRAKLIKLMGMTTSASDAEALVAIRKANAMLKVEGTSWSEFISGIKQQAAPRPPPRPQGRGFSTQPTFSTVTDPDIPNILASLHRDAKRGFRDFVESLQDYWDEHGHLTRAQYEAIITAHERAK